MFKWGLGIWLWGYCWMKMAQYHVILSFYVSGVDHIGYATTAVLMFIMNMSMYGMATSTNPEFF